MTNRGDWEGRTGRKWAEEWRRTDRSFAPLTHRLLQRAREDEIRCALDVGCGAGELSLALARDLADAQFVGIDVSAPLIEVARRRGADLTNVHFETADAAHWQQSGFAPDLIVSRHGVMFFDEPVPAFAHLAGISTPRSRLVFSCFRDRRENPWATEVAALLPVDSAPPDQGDGPGPFAFADPVRVEGILTAAGWREVAFEAVDFDYVAGAGVDPVGDAVAYFLSIGPAAAAAAALNDTERAAFAARLHGFLADRSTGDSVSFPAAAWIVTAVRA